MGGSTPIEWTKGDDGQPGKTWNPTTGCSKVSSGCKHCYAERLFPRAYGRDRAFTDVRTHTERLYQPMAWRRPARIFVNSMSDLFHEDIPAEFILKVYEVMGSANWHTYQILTKRPGRALELYPWLSDRLRAQGRVGLDGLNDRREWKHVHLGVSVEDQVTAHERIPPLLLIPAAVRFVSYEPALGPVDFERVPLQDAYLNWAGVTGVLQPLSEQQTEPDDYRYFTRKGLKLDWIIVGGESGPGARPFDVRWARDVIAQCKAAGVPCFVKQLGSNPVTGYTIDHIELIKDRKGGDMSEWPEDLRVREFPRDK